jgi:uncharacterized protein (TIGR00251 family)
MTPPCLRQTADGVLLDLRVVPRASANAIAGLQGQALKVRVTAPPVDSAANVEVVRFLAETLGLPRGGVSLVRGATGRHKQVLVRGLSIVQVGGRLGILGGPGPGA